MQRVYLPGLSGNLNIKNKAEAQASASQRCNEFPGLALELNLERDIDSDRLLIERSRTELVLANRIEHGRIQGRIEGLLDANVGGLTLLVDGEVDQHLSLPLCSEVERDGVRGERGGLDDDRSSDAGRNANRLGARSRCCRGRCGRDEGCG